MHEMLEKYSINEGLLRELERLREENKNLKAKYWPPLWSIPLAESNGDSELSTYQGRLEEMAVGCEQYVVPVIECSGWHDDFGGAFIDLSSGTELKLRPVALCVLRSIRLCK